MNAPSYTATGSKNSSSATLAKDIFNVDVKNHQLLKESYNAYLANGRENIAITKTRGLVRGGGRKPWRQKGTGRARFGSSRNPIWRGGGIVFGPTGKENYVKNINLKARRQALRQALSLVAKESKIKIIEDINLKEPKTANLKKIINKLELKGRVLLVVDTISDNLELASRNIPKLIVLKSSQLNVFDTLNADHIVFSKAGMKEIEKRLEIKS
jgi:large subunit ribosomal protein L4